MDQIFISGLKLSTIIGCLPAEQTAAQPIILDIILHTDTRVAANTDDIGQAVDYAAVVAVIQHHINNHRYQLVETLAEQLATLLLQQFAITQVTLKISKPQAVRLADNVGVQIIRKKPCV